MLTGPRTEVGDPDPERELPDGGPGNYVTENREI